MTRPMIPPEDSGSEEASPGAATTPAPQNPVGEVPKSIPLEADKARASREEIMERIVKRSKEAKPDESGVYRGVTKED